MTDPDDAALATMGVVILLFAVLTLAACTAGVVWLWTLVIP